MGKKWTDKDIKILKDNLNKSNKELANLLGRTEDSINNKKKKLKLIKNVKIYEPRKGEIFKNIIIDNVEYPNYKISNFGIVTHNNIELKQTLCKTKMNSGNYKTKGYLTCKIYDMNKNVKTVRVHRLVALMFVENKNPNLYDQVDHLDGDTTNNVYTNLEWVTGKENVERAIKNGQNKIKYGAKLTKEQVIEICEILSTTKISCARLAEKYKVNEETIRSIKVKKSWKEITNNYNFNE